jgi:type IV pilus assembly protein PilZ
MRNAKTLSYVIPSQLELNLSFMPFIKNGGLFIPTNESFALGEAVIVDLQLHGNIRIKDIEGRVVWITPKNALYQIYPGVGVQFIGDHAKALSDQIKANLDNSMDVGGYAYGFGSESSRL